MHADPAFYSSISGFLGSYYLIVATMNAIVALLDWSSGRAKTLFMVGPAHITSSMIWLLVSLFFLLLSPIAFSGDPNWMWMITVPEQIRHRVNWLMSPTAYTIGFLLFLAVMFVLRKYWVHPVVAFSLFNLSLLVMGLSITDYNFANIVTKADNVPIVGLIFLLGFFTWLATYRAVQNDARAKQGLEPLEKLDSEKILVWPDLVYTELICMVALTAILLIWAILLPAPLEEPASAVKTPNPSKAPWYFLGLQELLVYYDPWMAGVVLPSLVVFGLMAIPFLDFNKKGNGYYTIEQRPFAYLTFQFGFFILWISLIVMGTFLRGPNWNFFGPYETWDVHKVEALNNVDLSEYFWINILNSSRPRPPEGAGEGLKFGYALLRELPGIVLLVGYMTLIPPALVLYSRAFRDLFLKMGLIRYMTLTFLFLVMALVPIKMLLRWSPFHIKYFIGLPEYMLNF